MFDRMLFMLNEIFSKNSLERFVVLLILLIVPFALELINYSTSCQSLKISKKSMSHGWAEEAITLMS